MNFPYSKSAEIWKNPEKYITRSPFHLFLAGHKSQKASSRGDLRRTQAGVRKEPVARARGAPPGAGPHRPSLYPWTRFLALAPGTREFTATCHFLDNFRLRQAPPHTHLDEGPCLARQEAARPHCKCGTPTSCGEHRRLDQEGGQSRGLVCNFPPPLAL